MIFQINKTKRLWGFLPLFILTLIGCAACISFQSCTDEMIASREDKREPSGTLEQPVYVSFQMKETAPAATRAESDDTETALSYESKITDVTIIIAEKESGTDADPDGYYFEEDGSLSPVKFTAVAIGEAYDDKGFAPDNGVYTITAKIEKADVESIDRNSDLYVFIVANSKSNLNVDYQSIGRGVQKSLKTDVNSLSSLFEEGRVPEANKGFLMSSKEIRKISLSWSDLTDGTHYTSEKALKIGGETPINIHRLPARIDLDWTHTMFRINKEGQSQVIKADNTKEGGFQYEENNLSSEDNLKYTLKIDGIALVNMGQHYYLFQESGKKDANPERKIEWEIFGEDNNSENGRFVRDPFGVEKENLTAGFSDYFFQSLNDIDLSNTQIAKHSDYYFRKLDEFALKTHIDKYDIEGAYQGAYKDNYNKDYAIFQYVLPNSVHNEKKQLKNNSTGVVFRAEISHNKNIENAIDRLKNGITDKEDPTIKKHLTENDVYAFKNEIFGDYISFYQHVFPEDENVDNSGTYETLLFNLVWENYLLNLNNKIQELENILDNLQEDEEETLRNELEERIQFLKTQQKSSNEDLDKSQVDPDLFRESCVRTGLRVYRATRISDNDWKYYCYYYYWIRHNHNNIGNMMAPMEFAIVRNYVYKLSISKIFDLGYPDYPGDDPDPLDPKEEVEQSDLRIEVLTRILPWGVREDPGIILD